MGAISIVPKEGEVENYADTFSLSVSPLLTIDENNSIPDEQELSLIAYLLKSMGGA